MKLAATFTAVLRCRIFAIAISAYQRGTREKGLQLCVANVGLNEMLTELCTLVNPFVIGNPKRTPKTIPFHKANRRYFAIGGHILNLLKLIDKQNFLV